MRRFRWLPWVCPSLVIVGATLLLDNFVQAEALNEAQIQRALLQRFDENRNDKLDSGEARLARARLRTLMEDRSEGEINILTWRDDVRELLQAIDQDDDNRLTVAERDAGRALLESLIPRVDPQAPKERDASSSSSVREKGSDRATRSNRGPSGGSFGSSSGGNFNRGYGGAMGGGGFGNSLSGANTMRPGMGDPGNGMFGGGFGGAMPMSGGIGFGGLGMVPSTSGGFGNGSSIPGQSGVIGPDGTTRPKGLAGATSDMPPPFSSGTGKMRPIEGPLGDTPSTSTAFPGSASLGISIGGGSETSPNAPAPTKPGVPTTGTTPGGTPGTKPDGLPPGTTPPDSLGGGMSPPMTDGPAATPGQTTSVPFIPKPNF